MSVVYYPDGCNSIPQPSCNDCPTRELGRVRSIFFKKNSFNFIDISNPAEWANAICNKDVYVFPKTNGSLTQAETMEQGFGDMEEMLQSYTYTLQIKEENVNVNCDFWNQIKRSTIFQVGWRSQTQIYLSDAVTTIIPKKEIADDLKQSINWAVTVKFTQADIPCNVDMPVGVFDKCVNC